MDKRHMWWERDGLEWWAQHMLTEPVVATVDILHFNIDAILRALKVRECAEPESERSSLAARGLHSRNEEINHRRLLRICERDVSGDLIGHHWIPGQAHLNRVYQGLWYTVRAKTKGANRNATLRN